MGNVTRHPASLKQIPTDQVDQDLYEEKKHIVDLPEEVGHEYALDPDPEDDVEGIMQMNLIDCELYAKKHGFKIDIFASLSEIRRQILRQI